MDRNTTVFLSLCALLGAGLFALAATGDGQGAVLAAGGGGTLLGIAGTGFVQVRKAAVVEAVTVVPTATNGGTP